MQFVTFIFPWPPDEKRTDQRHAAFNKLTYTCTPPDMHAHARARGALERSIALRWRPLTFALVHLVPMGKETIFWACLLRPMQPSHPPLPSPLSPLPGAGCVGLHM